MDSKKANAMQDFRMSLHGLPYDHTVAAEPPIQITTIKQHQSSAAMLKTESTESKSLGKGRDSAGTTGTRTPKRSIRADNLPQVGISSNAPAVPANESSTRNSQVSLTSDSQAPSSLTTAPSVPQIRIEDEALPNGQEIPERGAQWPLKTDALPDDDNPVGQSARSLPGPGASFQGLTLNLPGGGLGDELQVNNMKFSQRGSMFIDGRKVNQMASRSTGLNKSRPGPQRIFTSSSVPDPQSPRMMSTDEEVLSEKVRSYYAVGADMDEILMANQIGSRWQETVRSDSESAGTASRRGSADHLQVPRSPGAQSNLDSAIEREENELAGGVEDWQDIDNDDVDRYGFIVPRSPQSSTADATGLSRSGTVSGQGLQRVSTSLQMVSEAPRRKHTIRRTPSSAHGERNRNSRRKDSDPSVKSNGTRPGTSRSAGASLRSGTLRGKDKRLMHDAADMFTLPPSLATPSSGITRTTTNDSVNSSASQLAASKMTSSLARKKEVEREEKWRKMAKSLPTPTAPPTKIRDFRSTGTTLIFSFPPITDPKLISRTWKGIPDSWRAQAWHYFLSVSAAKRPDSLTDDKLIKLFHDYQAMNSPDDVQIDIDVPRTINSHIMFRRRYRGGQRLLFRVLHAMSLHWPETGYVQGMAALAATLLAYYEEEKAFIMLVRLWDVRGLGRLYESGFGGLMEALDTFEKQWLGEGEVAQKLNEVNIFPTAYGTKWYLTLFNYSIPFPAQLRVWDVFMLLGDDESVLRQKSSQGQVNGGQSDVQGSAPQQPPFGTTLDVLHAASAALIDGMRDILLESDFENAMKVLTGWIPIRDEDLFMRVAKAEWKMHRKRIAN